jgi:tetratricopeptide (TPR) repeat protein
MAGFRWAGWLLAGLILCGCRMGTLAPMAGSSGELPVWGSVEEAVAYADRLSEGAHSRDLVLEGIAAYEQVLVREPGHYHALSMMANQYILLGAAYERGRGAKAEAYRLAMAYAERALQTNGAFAALRQRGDSMEEASAVLTTDELEAMAFWVTAAFYYFDECFYSFEKLFHQRKLSQARRMLERASALDPDFGGGVLHVSWGIYYLAVPPVIGGSREKSEASFEAALRAGEDRMLTRWSRARYFSVKYGETALFRDDLEWVLRQTPETVSDHDSWRFFMQRDAAALLQEAGR